MQINYLLNNFNIVKNANKTGLLFFPFFFRDYGKLSFNFTWQDSSTLYYTYLRINLPSGLSVVGCSDLFWNIQPTLHIMSVEKEKCKWFKLPYNYCRRSLGMGVWNVCCKSNEGNPLNKFCTSIVKKKQNKLFAIFPILLPKLW